MQPASKPLDIELPDARPKGTPAAWFMWRPSLPALSLAGLAAAGSLTPSLLPRPWHLQGIISALAVVVGYLIGHATGRLLAPMTSRIEPSEWTRRLRLAALTAVAVVLLWGIALHWVWQSDVRRLMGMSGSVAAYTIGVVAIAAALGYLLLALLRVLRRAWGWFVGLLARWMPDGIATAAAFVTLVVVVAVGLDVLVAGRLFGAVGNSLLAANERHDPTVEQPQLTTLAGGPGSLIDWEGMGRQGRLFVSSARLRAELEDFNGRPAEDPIRVYVGLDSADSVTDRARLAVTELERIGAFEREAIVLIAPTGTGWIDPFAVDPLEFIFNGNTAAVAVQYSYLPSWVLLLGNQDVSIASTRALLEAVQRRIASMDASERPILLLYGESLGSFALEALFDDLDDVRRRADGVLWVGPSFANRLWSDLTAQREQGSPIWHPNVGDGAAVRFGPDAGALSSIPGPWHRPRVVYLQHPSDPITWFSPDLIVGRPAWLDEPRGSDVSRWMPYVPGVTYLQVLVDLAVGTNAPLGHGHKFGAAQSDAWALIVASDTWSEGDADRLRALIEKEAETTGG